MDWAEIKVVTGEVYTVQGSLDEVEQKVLGGATLVWLSEYGTDASVGLNPAHIVSVKASALSE
jgi:hypothetical protein